jgi:hypothetical protein
MELSAAGRLVDEMRPHVAADAAAAGAHDAAVERLDGEIVGKTVNRQCAAVMADEAGAIDQELGHAVPAGISTGGRLAIAPTLRFPHRRRLKPSA